MTAPLIPADALTVTRGGPPHSPTITVRGLPEDARLTPLGVFTDYEQPGLTVVLSASEAPHVAQIAHVYGAILAFLDAERVAAEAAEHERVRALSERHQITPGLARRLLAEGWTPPTDTPKD